MYSRSISFNADYYFSPLYSDGPITATDEAAGQTTRSETEMNNTSSSIEGAAWLLIKEWVDTKVITTEKEKEAVTRFFQIIQFDYQEHGEKEVSSIRDKLIHVLRPMSRKIVKKLKEKMELPSELAIVFDQVEEEDLIKLNLEFDRLERKRNKD